MAITNIIHGTNGNDNLTGEDVANGGDLINAFAGDDTLFGNAGNDDLIGGEGNDLVFGGQGNDLLRGADKGRDSDLLAGGSEIDTATYGEVQHGMEVDLVVGRAQALNPALRGPVDALISIENVNGTAFDDSLAGNSGANSLGGFSGNDKLFGGEGNDVLHGGPDLGSDSDTLDGGFGIDTATYAQVGHGMFINLFQGLASGQGNVDFLTSIENITGTNFDDTITGDLNANIVLGEAGNDRIDTSSGNDSLFGGAGNDILIGGAGKDILSGSSGADKFVFKLATDSANGLGNRDLVSGFVHNVDDLDLSQIDAKPGAIGNQAFTFIAGSKFSAEGQVRFFFEGDHTVVALNTIGTGGAESQIELAGNISLAAADFVL